MNSWKQSARWYTKKAARGAVSWSAPVARIAQRIDNEPRLRVLTYHRFLERSQDPFSISIAEFAEQVAWLAAEQRLVSLADTVAYCEGKKSLRNGSVLITMDDGQTSMLLAGEVLARHNAPFVAFLTAGLIGSDIESDGERFMTWQEVQRLRELGATIGAHAFTHRSMGELPLDEVRDEALRARAELMEKLRIPVDAWAYPFGTARDFSESTDAAVTASGYRILFHSKHGALRRGQWLRSFPRVKIESGETFRQFKRIVDGGMDAWRWVDDKLSAQQRVRRELR